MSLTIRREAQHFQLDLQSLLALRVGGQAQAPSPWGQDENDAEAQVIALESGNRGALIAGLAAIWRTGRAARLCPNKMLQDSIKISPGSTRAEREVAPYEELDGLLKVPDTALIVEVLTSGSTGTPAAHQKRVEQLLGEALVLQRLLGLQSSDTVLATTAAHHVYGLLFGVLAPWAAGARIVSDDRNEADAFHPETIAELVQETSATCLVTVPAHLRALTQARPDLQGVTQVISSAAPLDPRDAQEFEDVFGISVRDVLGSTETGGIATRNPTSTTRWSPLEGVSLSLGEDKQLLLESPYADGGSGPQKTGERGRLHSDGSFEYLGRNDGIVKVGGKRLHLKEVEAAAKSLPTVTDAIALSRAVSSMRGQELLLVVEGAQVTTADVKRTLREKLDPTFVPRKIRIVGSLPHDERGKLSRQSLLALFSAANDSPANQSPQAEKLPSRQKQSPEGEMTEILIIPEDSRRFEGHFPGAPLYPGVAQLIDLILPALRKGFAFQRLSELKRVKWSAPIHPGDALQITIHQNPDNERRFRFQIDTETDTACTGIAVMSEPAGG